MSEVIQMSNIIKRDRRPPCGVWFWAQFYDNPNIVPRFEVFRYIGRQLSTGYYWFEAVKGQALISRTLQQLNQNGFRPFLLEPEKMMDAVAISKAESGGNDAPNS